MRRLTSGYRESSENPLTEKQQWQQQLDRSAYSGIGKNAYEAFETLDRTRPFALVCYTDILGYRALLERLGARALHSLLESALNHVDTSIADENRSRAEGRLSQDPISLLITKELVGDIEAYFAFDTIIFTLKDLDYENLADGVGRFLAFCSRAYLRLLIESGIMLRGLVAVSQDYVIEGPRITLREIDLLYRIEKALLFGGIVVAIPYLQLLPSWHCSRWGEDAVTYRNVPCKDYERMLPVLNLGFDQTVKWLIDEGLSIGSAGKRLESEIECAENEAKRKIDNTIAYLRWCIRDQTSMRWPPLSCDPEPDSKKVPRFDNDSISWAMRGALTDTFSG